MVHEIVGRINGHYGTLTHVPIHHLDRQLSFHELCALYAITDVALVTSLRDGMNLVSYEYVACQTDNAGSYVYPHIAEPIACISARSAAISDRPFFGFCPCTSAACHVALRVTRHLYMHMYVSFMVHTCTPIGRAQKVV